MIKHKNYKFDKTQNGTKLINLKFENSETKKCDKTQNSKCDKIQNLEM